MANEKFVRKRKRFLRQDAHKIKRLKKKWRRARGMHNKIRDKLKGHRASPTVGYGKAKSLKHMIGGIKPVLITNFGDLEKLTSNDGIILSSKLGLRKKVLMLNKIKQLKLRVLNLDIEKVLKKAEDRNRKKEEVKKEEKAPEKVAKEEKKEAKVEAHKKHKAGKK